MPVSWQSGIPRFLAIAQLSRIVFSTTAADEPFLSLRAADLIAFRTSWGREDDVERISATSLLTRGEDIRLKP